MLFTEMNKALVLYTWLSYVFSLSEEEFFEMNFQVSGVWSEKEWAEFPGQIPPLVEFTSCHWVKTIFVSTKSSHIWSYCNTEKTIH